jgi:hypothetical protein
MTVHTLPDVTAAPHSPAEVLNPVDVEHNIQIVSNRIANGVSVITKAEKEARSKRRAFDLAYAHAYKAASDEPAHQRKYSAEIVAMPHREAAEVAEIAFHHAERTGKALERELFAWQSILNSVRAMYNTAGAR